jgi:uncharacterized membrane protein
MIISQFFEGPNKTLSSKRLVGILAGLVSCYCIIRITEHFIAVNNSEALLRLADSAMLFTLTCLGLGISDHITKNKNETTPNSNSASNN